MRKEIIWVCEVCGTEFLKTRPDRIYCSRKCAQISARRAHSSRTKVEVAKIGVDCPYNVAVCCTERKCNSCGWNPRVEKERSAKLRLRFKEAKCNG